MEDVVLKMHRSQPILNLLEGIRRIAMVRHATRQHVAESWPDEGICPKIRTVLAVIKRDSRTCHAYPSGKDEYEVHEGRSQLPVSLKNRTCACGQWQISGIPCKHAVKAISFADKDPADYVSDWFSVRRYKEAYGLSINPIPDKDQWGDFNVPSLEPPTLKRSIGRPSRNRRREQGEKRKGKRTIIIKCRKCGGFGHNTRTCKGGNTAKEINAMQGKASTSRSKRSRKSDGPVYESLNALEGAIRGSSQVMEAAAGNTQDSSTVEANTQASSSKGIPRNTA